MNCPDCRRTMIEDLPRDIYACLACARAWTHQELVARQPDPELWLPPQPRPFVQIAPGLMEPSLKLESYPVLAELFKQAEEAQFGSYCGIPIRLLPQHDPEPFLPSAEETEITASFKLLFGAEQPSDPPPEPEPEPPESKPEEMPVIEGSIIGYRAWALNVETWRLTGTGWGRNTPDWRPGDNRASCGVHYTGHKAPAENCHCGFNCLARFNDDHAWWNVARGPGTGDIVGAVEAWSDDAGLIIDPPGFRAQYAKIVLLAINPKWPKAKQMTVRGLAADYGVDVCKIEHLEDAAKEHGQLVSDELLEWAAKPKPRSTFTGSPASEAIVAMSEFIKNYGMTFSAATSQLEESLKAYSALTKRLPTPPRPRKLKGIKQKLKTVGPPALGKWRTGDRVQDRKGQYWVCESGGSPGSWSSEEPVGTSPAIAKIGPYKAVADPQTGEVTLIRPAESWSLISNGPLP